MGTRPHEDLLGLLESVDDPRHIREARSIVETLTRDDPDIDELASAEYAVARLADAADDALADSYDDLVQQLESAMISLRRSRRLDAQTETDLPLAGQIVSLLESSRTPMRPTAIAKTLDTGLTQVSRALAKLKRGNHVQEVNGPTRVGDRRQRWYCVLRDRVLDEAHVAEVVAADGEVLRVAEVTEVDHVNPDSVYVITLSGSDLERIVANEVAIGGFRSRVVIRPSVAEHQSHSQAEKQRS